MQRHSKQSAGKPRHTKSAERAATFRGGPPAVPHNGLTSREPVRRTPRRSALEHVLASVDGGSQLRGNVRGVKACCVAAAPWDVASTFRST